MTQRIKIPIPQSTFPTRIEVYYEGELNRHGGVQAGMTEISIRLPAPIEECEIRIIPCNEQGNAVGRGHVYKDATLVPEPPANTDPPAPECPESASDEECCGKPDDCEGTVETSEIELDSAPSVELVSNPPDVDADLAEFEDDEDDDFDNDEEDKD